MTLPPSDGSYEIDCHAVASELREAMTKTEAVSDERLEELRDRARRYDGSDNGLEGEIFNVLVGVDAADAKEWYGGGGSILNSMDRAMALLERMLPGWHWSVYDTDGRGGKNCQVETPCFQGAPFDGAAATAPPAIIAALLSALLGERHAPLPTASEDAYSELAALISKRLLGVRPDDQDLQLEDSDWRLIIDALSYKSLILAEVQP